MLMCRGVHVCLKSGGTTALHPQQLFAAMQEIASRMREIETLQGEFRDLHKALEAVKAEVPPVEEVRRNILRRANERASLSSRIAKAKEKAERFALSNPSGCSCFT
jgi:septal ring factor EnvC (AmiA/AmiB activator)